MGILKSGLLGPFRKKVGPIIGRRHRGQDIITGLYDRTNKMPSKKVLESQLKFGLLSSFLSNIGLLVNIGFKHFAKDKGPLNVAYSYNYPHAFIKTGDSFSIDYPNIVFSRGHIATPEGAVVAIEGRKLTISWLSQPQSAYCQYTDIASFLVYNQKKNEALQLINMVSRFDQVCTIEMPGDFTGDTVHCYMSFASANGKLTGDSIYILGKLNYEEINCDHFYFRNLLLILCSNYTKLRSAETGTCQGTGGE